MWSYGGGGFFSLWMLIFAALLVVPFWRILPRQGIPNWVAIFAAIPIGALVLLWIVAFKDDIGPSGGKV